jgi:putative toxin-antitoxin system antitoxin component (TIGR02293 family)
MQYIVTWLGGKEILDKDVRNEFDLVDAVEGGLPVESIRVIQERGEFSTQEIATYIIARHAYTSRRRSGRLTPEQSDRVYRVASIMALAEETFQETEKAMHWMRRPNKVFDGRAPLDLIRTEQGARMVEDVLIRIAHGVYS